MNNYSIYHIHDTNTPSLMSGYIGITTQRVSQRFSNHKSNARRGVHDNNHLAEFLNNNPDATVTGLQENLTKAEAERLENLLRPIPNVGLNVLPGGCQSKANSGSNHPNFGRTPSDEHKAKMSATRSDGRQAGRKNNFAKVANIYDATTHELIAENVIIRVWARASSYDQGQLSATARADRDKPHHWKTNMHQHKGIYARYVSAEAL